MTYACTTVITQEGKWFVAHCVELGVVSQGKNAEEAQKDLKEAVELYLEDEPKHRKRLSRRTPLVTTLEKMTPLVLHPR
jgi:predicted RNase H-like HicB family nuclease